VKKHALISVASLAAILIALVFVAPDESSRKRYFDTATAIVAEEDVVEEIVENQTIPEPKEVETAPLPESTAPDQVLYDVVRVVDGDTVRIMMDGKETTLRLIGMNTPETVDPRTTVECFGKEASNKAKELLTGRKVSLEMDAGQGTFDKYHRTLGYIRRDDGLFFNEWMIKNGYAYEYTYDDVYKYQSEFKAAEMYAREHELGLWNSNTCGGKLEF